MAAVAAIAIGVIAANKFRIAAAERSAIGIIVEPHDAKRVTLGGSKAIDGPPPCFGPETGSDGIERVGEVSPRGPAVGADMRECPGGSFPSGDRRLRRLDLLRSSCR